MLYRPEAHERLTEEPWDEERVRTATRAIVADAEAAFDPDSLWPAHDWDAFEMNLPLTHLYSGAAGTVLALHAMRRHVDVELDLRAASRRVLELWRAGPGFDELPHMPDLPPERDASYWMGETGPLLVAWLVEPEPELADALLARVRENARSRTNELMWGAPGTMHAARCVWERTGDARWADAWRESADELRRRRDADGLWTTRLYGNVYRSINASHGFAANARTLLQGGADPEIERAAREGAARTAVVEDGLTNWPISEERDLVAEDGEIRVQWCAGAGGMVEALANVLDEELLLAGAELVWRAGPPAKGPMLCHGTAGNGYALLKVFRRTGDERWLERARRFAMHALAQVDTLPPRYSLFGGGLGAALFAVACIGGDARFPTLELWD